MEDGFAGVCWSIPCSSAMTHSHSSAGHGTGNWELEQTLDIMDAGGKRKCFATTIRILTSSGLA